MAWKHHDEMTIEEARVEAEWLESCFRDYAEIGQGISTKETIRHRMCQLKVRLHDVMGWTEERILAIPSLLDFEQMLWE